MENKERFLDIANGIKRPGIEGLMQWLENSDFYTAPASSRFHGAYSGGLLEHSLHVYDELIRLLKAYPEVPCNMETAAIIALFHDVCKVNMYVIEQRNRKNEQGQWEKYDAYKVQEKFKFGGHGSKSVFLLQNFIQLTPEEAVAINCHMGAFQDDHVGQCFEQWNLAFLLHVADGAATYIIENNNNGGR